MEEKVEVGRGGIMVVPKVATINANGISLGAARQLVGDILRKNYSNIRSVELQLLRVRDVQVFLLGEVNKPGSYVVPSVSSVVNLLGIAGGPSPLGSYRNIQVMRGGRVEQAVDLYQMRYEGKGLIALGLRDGDTVFVPLSGARIRAEGAFRRVPEPGPDGVPFSLEMELKDGETAADAIRWVGGLQPTAHPKLLTLQRTNPGNGAMRVENLDTADATLRATRLFEGDVVRALARVDRNEGQVEVVGHARVPGLFGLEPGMALKDLLGRNEQALPDTYMSRGELLRTLADGRTELYSFDVLKALQGDPDHNLKLQSRDRVELFSVEDMRLPKRVTVYGPFTKPGVYDWHDNMRASDLIFRAGVPKLGADRYYAELARFRDGKHNEVVKLDLSRLLSDETRSAVGLNDDAVNPRLQPYDQITLYETPNFRVHRTVRINGMVKRPGVYTIEEDHFSLKDLVARAGGLVPEAMVEGGIFLRSAVKAKDLTARQLTDAGVDPNDPTVQGINQILERLDESRRGKTSDQIMEKRLLHDLRLGNVNRLVVDFEEALSNSTRKQVELMDGDEIFIPRKVANAYVVGEVASPFSTFQVQKGDTVSDLLKLAGGLTRNADTGQIRLLRANGQIVDTWVMSRRVRPGDAVLVPQRIKRDSSWQENLQALTPIALLLNAIK
jgi:protein involved in polysaccharide export with SLBB domain